jgi:hypothetical protein
MPLYTSHHFIIQSCYAVDVAFSVTLFVFLYKVKSKVVPVFIEA